LVNIIANKKGDNIPPYRAQLLQMSKLSDEIPARRIIVTLINKMDESKRQFDIIGRHFILTPINQPGFLRFRRR